MTLEEDLIDCFERRGILVERLDVEKGATLYKIKVKRVKEHIKEMKQFLKGKDLEMP